MVCLLARTKKFGGDVVYAGLDQLDLAQNHRGSVNFPQSHPNQVEHAYVGIAHKRLQPQTEKLEEHQGNRQDDQAEDNPGDCPDGTGLRADLP